MSPSPEEVPEIAASAGVRDRPAMMEMTAGDAAAALGLTFDAASKRRKWVLERLETILTALPGNTPGSGP